MYKEGGDLTPREKDILREYAASGTTRSVARKLGITESTVHTIRTNIIEKLDCEKYNMTYKAFLMGLLD